MIHDTYLKRTLALAAMRRGFCAPNPAVGAIVVKNGCVLAEGYHLQAGKPHAEVEALNKIGEQARDATLYVSLEPCCHQGRTPPCTDLIIERGIKEVYYGFLDPNPQVSGKGEQQLRAAGINCQYRKVPEITEFYRSYMFWREQQRPWVTAKLAMSLDGKVSAANGAPVTLTSEIANEFTHQQRKIADGLLTGINTILLDNPQFNCRLNQQTITKHLFIVDTEARLPLDAKIFSTTESITLFHAADANPQNIQRLQQQQVNCIPITRGPAGLDLLAILTAIGKLGVHDLWVEAGPSLFNALISARLVQKVVLYVAPKILGADAKNVFVNHLDLMALAKTIHWSTLGVDGMCEIEL